jgi:hypothetical protein
MSRLAERIKDRSRSVEPRRVEVPELGDESGPLVVYMHPLTLADRSKVLPLVAKNDLSAIVKAILLSARDEDGGRVFDLEDEKAMLRSRDTGWILRMSNEIAGDLDFGAETLGES